MGKIGKQEFLFLLCFLVAWAPSGAAMAEAGGPPSARNESISARVDTVESRLSAVEAEIAELRSEKRQAEEDLDHQKQEVAALKVQLAQQRTPSPAYERSESETAEDRFASAGPTTDWGTRLGYQGFPFGQREGGFFYSFFFDHRLASESEGLPFGDLYADVALGVARSGNDPIMVTSALIGTQVPVEFRQTMLSLWPSLKYTFNRWAPYGIRPYIVGGPGIWADIVESPPLFIGQSPPAPELANLKLPADAAANLYQGGQGGAGLEISLARTRLPILERLNLGFDYRYSAWTAGQRFSTYSFSLSAGE